MSRAVCAVAIAIGAAVFAVAPAEAKLRLTRADGTVIPMVGTPRVTCSTWDDFVSRRSVHVTGGLRKGGWRLSAVRRDIRLGRRMTFPNSFPATRPRRALVYVRHEANEASTQEEESAGGVTFTRVSCTPGRTVAFTIDATVGSEYSDGEPIRVSGSFRGRVRKS